MNSLKQRPRGVTVIGFLNIIIAIEMFFWGIVLLALEPRILNLPTQMLGGIPLVAMVGVLFAFGIAYFVLVFGLWRGKGWAWGITIALNFIGIPLNIISIIGGNMGGIIGLTISPIILYYLFRPHVKTYFGRTRTTTTTIVSDNANLVGEKSS